MKRAKKHHPASNKIDLPVLTTVTLAYDERHRRRIKMTADNGEDFLLDLEQAAYLAEGDLLELEDATAIKVIAALEDVMDVKTANPSETARIAWHIGNRHMPIQVLENGQMRLRYDHVLQHMIEGLGGTCQKKTAPFAPEPGAYSSGEKGHGHAHP